MRFCGERNLMPDLSLLLGLLGASVTVAVTIIYVITGVLLSVAGGIGIGLYLAAWTAWAYEDLHE